MIVFLHGGGGALSTADAAFCEHFGADRVGWVGRNVSPREVRQGLPPGRFDLVGGRLTLAMFPTLEPVSLVTMLLCDPVRRAVTEWGLALGDPEHPHHAIAHTLTLREVIEERHPFRALICNAATRALIAPGAKIVAQSAVDSVLSRPTLIGHTDHRGPYFLALTHLLGLPPRTFDPHAFRPLLRAPPGGELLALLEETNRQDRRLMQAFQARANERSVWRANT